MDELLKSLGCEDIESTKARFLNDSDFYLEVIMEMLRDPGFEQLGLQLQNQEFQEAFNTAHMLKGIVGNCGITPLYKPIVRIVEYLRAGETNPSILLEQYARVMEKRNALLQLFSISA